MNKLFLILLLAVPVAAQTDALQQLERLDVQKRIDKLDDKNFVLTYDKFKDQSTLNTKVGFRIPRAGVDSIDLNVYAQFAGQNLTNNIDIFDLYFIPRWAYAWKDLTDHHCIFLLDGQPMEFKNSGHRTDDYIWFQISRTDLQKIADATVVEVQLGSVEAKGNKDKLPRLKTFLELTKK